MTTKQAVDKRISRRTYINKPVDTSVVYELKNFISDCIKATGLNIQVVINNGDAFKGFMRSYGLLTGVQNYIALISNEDIPNCNEQLGYFGEAIVIRATMLGLGTCWVGGSFDAKQCPFSLKDSEKVVVVIPFGYCKEEKSLKEKLIHSASHRKTKSIEQMSKISQNTEVTPDWFYMGMTSVQKAPSAMNGQPAVFEYDNGIVTGSVENPTSASAQVDLGIAKLHFEIGAGGGQWAFGNGGKFVKQQASQPQENSAEPQPVFEQAQQPEPLYRQAREDEYAQLREQGYEEIEEPVEELIDEDEYEN